MRPTESIRRRTFLKTAAVVGIAGPLLAGCTGTGTSNDGDGSPATESNDTPTDSDSNGGSGNGDAPAFGGWLDDTANYDSVADETDASTVDIEVGAEGNNGPYAFAPPAVRIGTGTTITWKWTGEGGSHNVVAQDGTFESEMSAEKGNTFEHTFDSSGTYKYVCVPHEAMGMKGVVVVE